MPMKSILCILGRHDWRSPKSNHFRKCSRCSACQSLEIIEGLDKRWVSIPECNHNWFLHSTGAGALVGGIFICSICGDASDSSATSDRKEPVSPKGRFGSPFVNSPFCYACGTTLFRNRESGGWFVCAKCDEAKHKETLDFLARHEA